MNEYRTPRFDRPAGPRPEPAPPLPVDLYGIPVRVIRPGDPLHPGGDATYVVNLREAQRAARSFTDTFDSISRLVSEPIDPRMYRAIEGFALAKGDTDEH